MVPTHFDNMTRSLSVASSRRSVLTRIAGAAVAAAAMRLPSVASAKKKRKKSCKGRCGPCEKCVRGKCKPKALGATCGDGGICLTNGSCARDCAGNLECGPDCTCGGNVEFGANCIVSPLFNSCDLLQACTSTTECPQGHQCEAVSCNGVPAIRCLPLCQV
jgi:hypothetical protein